MVERVLYTALSDSMTALFLSAQPHHFFASPNLWILVSGFWPLCSGFCGLWPHWLIGSSACWPVGSLARRLIGSSACWLVGSLAHRLIGLSACWLVGSLARRLIGSLACWLIGSGVLLTVTCVCCRRWPDQLWSSEGYNTACTQYCEGAASRYEQRVVEGCKAFTTTMCAGLMTCWTLVKRL